MLRIVTLALAFACFSGQAFAMSCHPPENWVKEFPVIFKGIAEKTIQLPQDIKVEDLPEFKEKSRKPSEEDIQVYTKYWIGLPQVTNFKIIEFYKGREEKQFDIYHRSAGSLFGAEFKTGETYIVYADIGEDKKYATSTGFCSPSIAVNDIKEKEKDKTYSQLKIFTAQKDAFDKLLEREPGNPYYLYDQGLFYEGYNDFYRAGESYLEGLNASQKWPLAQGEHVIRYGANDSIFNAGGGLPFTAKYGRMLFMQGRYAEAAKPLGYAQDDESKSLQNANLIKLKEFSNLSNKSIDMKNMKVDSLDLTGATLNGLDLSGSTVGELILDKTTLDGANFDSATIRKLSIKNSVLTNAIFARAQITGGVYSSKLPNADFSRAKLYFSNLDKADFSGANFAGATVTVYETLTDSVFAGAWLNSTNFSGSQLFVEVGGVKGIPLNTTFEGAYYDDETKWFKDFDPVKAGAKKTLPK